MMPTFSIRAPRPSHLLALMLLTLAFAGSGCRDKTVAAPVEEVLLQVNGRIVTLETFDRQFAQSLPDGAELAQDERDELRRSFLRQVIDRELVLSEADSLNIRLEPGEIEQAEAELRRDYPAGAFDEMLRTHGLSQTQWRRDLEARLLMEKILTEVVFASITVNDEDVSDYYQAHFDEFDRPRQVRARQILVDNREQGEEILEQLRRGESFAELAQRFSLSPDANQGGDLGFFSEDEMPEEFDQVVFSLGVGQLSGLVESAYGFHIFYVEERREARQLSLEDAAPLIRTSLRRSREEQAYDAWLLELGGKARLEINWSLL